MSLDARTQALLVGAGQVVGNLVSLVTVAALARALPPEQLGHYLYFVAVAAALEGLTDLGLRFKGVSELSAAAATSLRLAVLRALWQLKAVLSTVTCVAILLAAAAGAIEYVRGFDAPLLALACVTLPSSNPVVWDARARGLQWLEAALLVAYRVAILLGVVAVSGLGLDAGDYLLILIGANVSFTFVLHVLVKRSSRGSGAPAGAALAPWTLLRGALPLGLSLLLAQVAPRVWVVLLAATGSAGEVAIFSIAASVVQAVLLVSVAGGSAYLPTLTRLAREAPAEYRETSSRLLEAMALLGAAASVGIALGASGVVPAFFGEAMRPAAIVLVALAVLPPMMLVSFTSRIVLSASGPARMDFYATLVGIGCGLALAWLLGAERGLWSVVAGYACSELVAATFKIAVLARLHVLRAGRLALLAALVVAPIAAAVAVGVELDRARAGPWLAASAAVAGVLCYAAMLWAVPSIRARGLRGQLP